MKVFALLISSWSAVAMSGTQIQNPVEVEAPLEKIFIPMGFDDNDNTELVLHGNFPNTCYQVGRAEAKIDSLTKTIMVTATSFKYPGKVCLQTITPFIQTVKLGLIPAGEYEVQAASNKQIRSKLMVEKRKTESSDDYLYATVENAYIDVNFETGKQVLKLQGHYPFFFIGCMVIKEVRVIRNPLDVLVVQPIADIVDDETCQNQPSDRSFESISGLPEAFHGEGLLHVRTLNGNSLNRYINIQ